MSSSPGFQLQKKYTLNSPADLEQVVHDLRVLFKTRTLLLLEGPVGAGKTELVKALTRSMNLAESASPSFAIHHRYGNMDHVDLYRLQNEDDLESTGFWDLFGQEDGLVVIEWSDRLNQELLPLNWSKIKVVIEKPTDPTKRILSVFV